jgi:hypothetical protein
VGAVVTAKRLGVAALAFLIIAAMSFAAAAAISSAQSSSSCSTSPVDHTAFRNDTATVDTLANDSAASSTVSNTRVTLEPTDAFYRLTAENPNAYCVRFRLEVSGEAMEAAQIPGTVRSNDRNHTATWDARHDFDAEETYTIIEFTLPAETTAEFAPSRYRVIGLSWSSSASTKAESIWERLQPDSLKPTVEERHYTIHEGGGEGQQVVSVPLRNPSTGESVEDYQLMYTQDGGETWQSVPTDTDAPVYKQELESGTEVRLTFNEEATVELTVEPTVVDTVRRDIRNYRAGLGDLPGLGDLFGDEEAS